MREQVVLLHGILRTSLSMRGLEKYLARQEYDVLNLGYPSTRYTLKALAERIYPAIDAFRQPEVPLHMVGYSMGALLTRAYLYYFRPQRLGRVVMLAPPNRGSPVADALKPFAFYQWLYGPAGQQLGTDQPIVCLPSAMDYELGIIAGNRSIDPFSSWLIGEPNDGKVAVAHTRLEGMKEHIVLPVTHAFLLENRHVWRHTGNFLKHGYFMKEKR